MYNLIGKALLPKEEKTIEIDLKAKNRMNYTLNI